MAQERIQRLIAGDRRTLSRLITLVERRDPQVPDILRQVHSHLKGAYCVGVTGPPGAGKSTLINSLASLVRKENQQVGILAVDPTSTFSGGAVLGDRIRMQHHALDPGVYIRSMATQGAQGGLSSSVGQVVRLLDAAGTDMVLVETVGVGQTELDITTVADTVIVVLVPEAGDTVQTMKAGLTEIADIFVVNKIDREGGHAQMVALRSMLALGKRDTGWRVPVLGTQANQGKGIGELYATVQEHRRFLESSSTLEARRRERRRREFLLSIEETLRLRLADLLQAEGALADLAGAVEQGEVDPATAAQDALKDNVLPKALRPAEPE
ncbi:MAG: methylmalonyl Co-A mutase-associated GTPase MeaB [Chloroflexi bacterium]|nr:methylmalonyl Co-A mutase-associated GTPase MeaB [Chloroflexota bacterium]